MFRFVDNRNNMQRRKGKNASCLIPLKTYLKSPKVCRTIVMQLARLRRKSVWHNLKFLPGFINVRGYIDAYVTREIIIENQSYFIYYWIFLKFLWCGHLYYLKEHEYYIKIDSCCWKICKWAVISVKTSFRKTCCG
jgi:hypothetical protein